MSMARIALAVALAAACMAGPAESQDDEKGFEKLFNGTDFTGWKFFLGKDKTEAGETFKVKDGIVWVSGKPNGYMYTEKTYTNYTLRFEYRYTRPANVAPGEDLKWGGNSGYLHWIKDHNVWPKSLETQGMNKEVGQIYWIGLKKEEKGKCEFSAEAAHKAVKPLGEWNAYEVVARAPGTVVVTVNGVKTCTVTEHPYTGPGHIGFQSEGAEIQWRNIRIKVEEGEKK
jgi:hypothetical protein